MKREAPRDEHELLVRAQCLAGLTVSEIARTLDATDATGLHAKGKTGTLLEAALGATGGSAKVHDFPDLGIELKTIPVDDAGKPEESTYVCTLPLDEVETMEWSTSWVRSKLAHVLWVPIATATRRVLPPVLWRPTASQDAVLQADFEEIVGTIAIGGIEGLTARTGRWLQLRPKAADGTPRAVAWGRDGEAIATVPRGFYLRARFTGALLADPAAEP